MLVSHLQLVHRKDLVMYPFLELLNCGLVTRAACLPAAAFLVLDTRGVAARQITTGPGGAVKGIVEKQGIIVQSPARPPKYRR